MVLTSKLWSGLSQLILGVFVVHSKIAHQPPTVWVLAVLVILASWDLTWFYKALVFLVS